MTIRTFDEILSELSEHLGIPLKPDKNDSCLIIKQDEPSLQMELSDDKKELMLVIDFGELPPGAYRTSLFEEALKSNSMEYPRFGAFAFSRQANHLIMFKLFSLENLTNERLTTYLTRFREKGKKWFDAIKEDRVPTTSSEYVTGKHSGMFGLSS